MPVAAWPAARTETRYVPLAVGLPSPAARVKTMLIVPGPITLHVMPCAGGMASETTLPVRVTLFGVAPFTSTAPARPVSASSSASRVQVELKQYSG